MKIRVMFILALLLTATAVSAKKKAPLPKAEIKVSYNYHEKYFRGSDGVVEKDVAMILLSGKEKSRFYSPHDNYLDSLDSTPKGRALSKQMFDAAVRAYSSSKDLSAMDNVVHKCFIYVIKDFPSGTMTVYDKTGLLEHGRYEEPFDEQTWQIGDSVKNILGYDCMIAETDYHGRHWTVWFAPELPVSDGPWKFCGLPGLILEATEPSGQHSFLADGIESSEMTIYPVHNEKSYDRMNRIDMLRGLRDCRSNSNAIVKASIGLDLGPDAAPTEESKIYDFLETDYHE